MSFIEFLFWMPWWGWLLLIAGFYFAVNLIETWDGCGLGEGGVQ